MGNLKWYERMVRRACLRRNLIIRKWGTEYWKLNRGSLKNYCLKWSR